MSDTKSIHPAPDQPQPAIISLQTLAMSVILSSLQGVLKPVVDTIDTYAEQVVDAIRSVEWTRVTDMIPDINVDVAYLSIAVTLCVTFLIVVLRMAYRGFKRLLRSRKPVEIHDVATTVGVSLRGTPRIQDRQVTPAPIVVQVQMPVETAEPTPFEKIVDAVIFVETKWTKEKYGKTGLPNDRVVIGTSDRSTHQRMKTTCRNQLLEWARKMEVSSVDMDAILTKKLKIVYPLQPLPSSKNASHNEIRRKMSSQAAAR